MSPIKLILVICLISTVFLIGAADTVTKSKRTARRIHLPFLGIGPRCTGCPEHFCDDDAAIVHGFCCGCARFFDNLPVKCPPHLDCPLNNYQLCDDYEYMMHCCCDR